ncbi:glycine--tRNA ligase subunit beta, partial [Candidatus Aerophobetes bacterium]|nr:glycine--tRNA ligase subunit beta [Candidatus Aerophobetes bacterium]
EDFHFGRPVRYLLSLLGEDTIPFEIAGIKSGRKTKGHRFLYPEFIEVPRAQDYFMTLTRKAVIPLPKIREKRILRQISKVLSEIQKKGFKPQLTEDRQLLEQTSYLIEHPTVFWGEFDRKYLFLPSFVLKACLREYQRLFTVQEGEKILPFFIGVREGGRQNLSEIVENNKRVIHARLNDAKFFYEEDRKIPLEKRVSLLKEVFVQEKLGSYYDKVQRIIKLNERIFSEFKVNKDLKKKIERAAYLCKADILTNMGREFPELQGTIGKEYALLWGEDESVARAIEEHRKPRFAGDTLPSSTEGAILAILDKIDTLCGAFWAGFIPSGSEDPWGLRREAQGIVEILLDREFDIDLQKLIDESMRLFSSRSEESAEKLKEFFKTRIFNTLRERGISQDKINAAFGASKLSPAEIAKKAKMLENVSSRKDFKDEAAAIIRVLNILKQANKWGIKIPLNIKEDTLKEKEEIELYRKWIRIKTTADMLLNQEKYLQAYKKLIQLKEPIHLFFDKVLVMSEDPALRLNRLALLRQIGSRFLQIGDFTQLQI